MRPRIILTVDDSPTIRKVVQVVLARQGHEVHVAADGEEGLRLAEEVRPDLILLDFVMPRMNGYQFCRAMAQSDALREVPVVLMSAKGDQIGERFVRVMGIIDYITKPFPPEALVEVVQRTLARAVEAGIDATGERSRAVDTDPNANEIAAGMAAVEAIDSETTDAHPIVSLDTLAPVVGAPRAGAPPPAAPAPVEPRVAPADDKVRDAIARAVAGGDAASAHLAEEVRARLTAKVIARLVDELGLSRPAPPSATLLGDLARVPLADVLALVAEQRQDGLLEARQERRTVQVCLRGGRVEYAGAEGLGDDFRLGSYLVRAEAIGRADLELFFGSRGPSSRMCGEELVKLGHVEADALRAALRRQTAERVYEALRFSHGRFELRPLLPDEPLAERAADAALGIAVDALLLEGIRRIDEWHLARREIGDDETVFLRNEEAISGLPPDALGREEQAVLELVNARNTVRDIVRQSRLGSFEVSQLLLRLRSTRLIRRRVQPVAV